MDNLTLDNTTFVLLFDETSTGIDPLRKALGSRLEQFRTQCVTAVPTALARIAGGGVDIVLISLPAGGLDAEPLDAFLKLREGAPKLPILVICDSYDESLGQKAVRKGAADYVIRETYQTDLLRILDSNVTTSTRRPVAVTAPPRPARRSRVLACMGAKGGPGTTTVAFSVASVLAQDHTVILAELHSDLGTLSAYCQPYRTAQDFGPLLGTNRAPLSAKEVESCLWPCKNVPGLQILFGPQPLESPTELGPDDARALLTALSSLADYVVVDLPPSLSETNRAVIESSDVLALVIERDPISVQSAKRILRAMDGIASTVAMGVVVVNRAGLVSPIPATYIESELPAPIFGVIPPAPDLCAAAQKARTPLVKFDVDSLAASSLRDLAKVLSGYTPVVQPRVAVG
jgi:pilus assembly protein CpaE